MTAVFVLKGIYGYKDCGNVNTIELGVYSSRDKAASKGDQWLENMVSSELPSLALATYSITEWVVDVGIEGSMMMEV